MNKTPPCIAYVHIEKAAGSTLHDIFLKNIFGYHIFSPYQFGKLVDNQSVCLTSDELKKIRSFYPFMKSFGGHSVRSYCGYEDVFEDILYVTFLREPIKRFYSHYLYQTEVMSIAWSLDDFIASGQFNNFMCNKIAGQKSFDSALKEINKRFFFVGIIEEFDKSLLELRARLFEIGFSFSSDYENKNTRTGRGGVNHLLSESDMNKIAQANLEDIKLYEHVKESRAFIDLEKETPSLFGNDKMIAMEKFRLVSNKIIRHCYVKWLEKIFRDQSRVKLS